MISFQASPNIILHVPTVSSVAELQPEKIQSWKLFTWASHIYLWHPQFVAVFVLEQTAITNEENKSKTISYLKWCHKAPR